MHACMHVCVVIELEGTTGVQSDRRRREHWCALMLRQSDRMRRYRKGFITNTNPKICFSRPLPVLAKLRRMNGKASTNESDLVNDE